MRRILGDAEDGRDPTQQAERLFHPIRVARRLAAMGDAVLAALRLDHECAARSGSSGPEVVDVTAIVALQVVRDSPSQLAQRLQVTRDLRFEVAASEARRTRPATARGGVEDGRLRRAGFGRGSGESTVRDQPAAP